MWLGGQRLEHNIMLALAREYVLIEHLCNEPAHHWTGTRNHFGQCFMREFMGQQNTPGILDPKAIGELAEDEFQTFLKGQAQKARIVRICRGP